MNEVIKSREAVVYEAFRLAGELNPSSPTIPPPKDALLDSAGFVDLPELGWLSVEKLRVDAGYQRSKDSDRSRASIAKIVKNFKWAYFGALIVARIDNGLFNVIDGQHRLAAALELGVIPKLPCLILSYCPLQAQARSFTAINDGRVNLTPLARYYAQMAAGDPAAQALQGILEEAEINVPPSPVFKGLTEPRQTQAVSTLLRMTAKHTRKDMLFALTIIPEAYGEQKGCMRASLIKALAVLHSRIKPVDRIVMMAVLKDLRPNDLEADAKVTSKTIGKSTLVVMTETLERYYARAQRKQAKT